MLSFDAVETAITARMEAMWDANALGIIANENVGDDPSGKPFVRIYVRKSIRPIGGDGLNTRAGRVRGSIVIVAYARIGAGKGANSQMIDAARVIFEEVSFNTNGAAIRVEMATDEVSAPENPWFKSMIAFPFWADEANPA